MIVGTSKICLGLSVRNHLADDHLIHHAIIQYIKGDTKDRHLVDDIIICIYSKEIIVFDTNYT